MCVCLKSGLPNPSQKLLELIREKSEEMAQRQLSKDQGLTKEHPKRVLRSQDSTLRIQQRPQNSKVTHISSCFGHKIDRIGSFSRLGCNGEHLPYHFPSHPCERYHQRPLGLLSGILGQPDSLQDQGSLSGNITWVLHYILTDQHLPPIRGVTRSEGAVCLMSDHPFTRQKGF